MSRRNTFSLFYSDNKNIYKDFKNLELSCESQEEVDSWKASFLRAGVYLDKSQSSTNNSNSDGDFDGSSSGSNQMTSLDPILERQVETIRNLVDSYMKIVTKTFRDLVPKLIMHLMINSTKNFILSELLASLYASGDQNTMMEESPEEERRRQEMLNTYHACKEALKIIGDVSMSTTYSPAPPPVKNDWQPSISPGPQQQIKPTQSNPQGLVNRGGPPPPPPSGQMNRGPPPPPNSRPAPNVPNRGAPGNQRAPPPNMPSLPQRVQQGVQDAVTNAAQQAVTNTISDAFSRHRI